MPSIRLRQRGAADTTATLSDQGLSAVQTLEKRQWDYLLSAYVKRQYHPAGKGLPAAMKDSLRRKAARARYDPKQRGPTGLPIWERGMVLVPPANWHGVIGGVLVQVKGRTMKESAFPCYVPMFVERELVPGRPLYLLVPPDG